ncbi:hypothetical protein M1D97_04995 [Kushneria sp. AK178]
MEYITLLSNVLLAILTAFYVCFTYNLVRQAKKSNEHAQESFERQIRLANYPHLTCSAVLDGKEVKLAFRNSSSCPALDVDILALSSYSYSDMSVENFIVNHVKPDSDFKKRLYDDPEETFYSVYDHVVYSEFESNKKVSMNLVSPFAASCIHVLLQFRDISGINYARVYWFFWESQRGEERFRLGDIDPKCISPTPRIDFDQKLSLVTDGGENPEKYIGKDFVSVWGSSIPSGHLLNSYRGVEDRGVWEDIG